MTTCKCTNRKARIISKKHFFVIRCKHCGDLAIGLTMKEATEAWDKIQDEKKEAC